MFGRKKKKETEKEPEVKISMNLMWDLNKRLLEVTNVLGRHGAQMTKRDRKRWEEEYAQVATALFYVASQLYEYPREHKTERLQDKESAIERIKARIAERNAEEEARIAREKARAEGKSDIKFSLGGSDSEGVKFSLGDPREAALHPSAFFVWKDFHQKMFRTFPKMLLRLIDEQHIDHITFYKRAGIDTKLFSKIVNTPDYRPSKNTAIQCCLGLQLNDEEAKMLLESAGYSLSPSNDFDLVIKYCIENKIYDSMDVDALLYAVTERTLISRY